MKHADDRPLAISAYLVDDHETGARGMMLDFVYDGPVMTGDRLISARADGLLSTMEAAAAVRGHLFPEVDSTDPVSGSAYRGDDGQWRMVFLHLTSRLCAPFIVEGLREVFVLALRSRTNFDDAFGGVTKGTDDPEPIAETVVAVLNPGRDP